MRTSGLTINVLGAPMLSSGTNAVELSPGASLLCAYLALAPLEGRTRDVVAAHLFSDCAETTARRRLNTALWRLRSEVREHTGIELVTSTDARRLGLSSAVELTIDAAVFEQLVEPVIEVPPEELTADHVARLERAVTMHRGQLVEACHDEWVMARRQRIENLYLTALDTLVRYYGARGELGAIAKYGDLALAIEPLREDIHRHLMTAYAAAGREDLVERQFERCRAVLLEELGADPLPETIALYSRLCRDEAATSASVASPTVTALTAELERARREVGRLADLVDRALEHVRRMQ